MTTEGAPSSLSWRTSMMWWWPVTRDLGIPQPATVAVEVDPVWAEGLMYGCQTHTPEDDDGCHWDDNPDGRKLNCVPLLDRYKTDIEAAAARLGYPVFVRTDLTSGKHFWRDTCFAPEADSLLEHVWAVLEFHAMASFPPHLGEDDRVRAIMLREFLHLEAPFTAFAGMPVAKERRYFVKDGEVVCHHPYWEDAENIANGLRRGGNFPPHNWREHLVTLNREPRAEVEKLTDYAKRVGQALPGAWSVDFAKTTNGAWYLIDMAVAEHSWHSEHV